MDKWDFMVNVRGISWKYGHKETPQNGYLYISVGAMIGCCSGRELIGISSDTEGIPEEIIDEYIKLKLQCSPEASLFHGVFAKHYRTKDYCGRGFMEGFSRLGATFGDEYKSGVHPGNRLIEMSYVPQEFRVNKKIVREN